MQIGHLSRPAWDAWIEMIIDAIKYALTKSRPAWDAWIEIKGYHTWKLEGEVASRMGRVD